MRIKPDELKVVLKPVHISKTENQKRMDEVGSLLYELYCHYQLKQSVHKNTHNRSSTKGE